MNLILGVKKTAFSFLQRCCNCISVETQGEALSGANLISLDCTISCLRRPIAAIRIGRNNLNTTYLKYLGFDGMIL